MIVSRLSKVRKVNGEPMAVLRDYSRYGVTFLGLIYDLKEGRFVKVFGEGSTTVILKPDGGPGVTWATDRFVCMCFHDNPKMFVRHLDGDKSNNEPENLEWSKTGVEVKSVVWKSGVDSPNWGKRASVETRRLQSEKKIGERNPRFKGWYNTPLGRFASFSEAGKAFGITNVSMFHKFNKMKGKEGWSFEKA